LGGPTVADRIAQEVARRYLEPIVEPPGPPPLRWIPARSSLPRLLPQIELPRFPDQCLSELIVLFRADELESGALVDAAGRRWENDQKLQPPSPAPLYVAVAERGLGDWRISSRTARQSRLRRIVGVLLQAAVTDSGMEHARKRAGSACRSIWSLWSRCGCLCDCLGPLRLERTLV